MLPLPRGYERLRVKGSELVMSRMLSSGVQGVGGMSQVGVGMERPGRALGRGQGQ